MTKINLLDQQTELPLYCMVEGKTIYELVIDEQEREITGPIRSALNEHLLMCRTCLGVYSRLKNIIRVVRAYHKSLSASQLPETPLGKGKNRKVTIM